MKNKFSLALSLAVIMSMLLTSIGLADNVKNDVVADGNDTITAGGSTTIKYWIQDTGNTCDAADGSSATVTIHVPAGVTASVTSLVFNSCNTGSEGNPNHTQSVTYSSSTPGNYPITLTVTDTSGTYNEVPAEFTLKVNASTNTAPVITVPANIIAEATSAAGAVVNYSASASDAEDGALAPTCSPASGSTFPLGTTTVNCSVTDSGGMSASGSFTVTVQDTTAPVLTVPSDMIVPATSLAGAVVTFSAMATDAVDASPVVTCEPASGSTFAPGKTIVSCTAKDFTGNESAPKTFEVLVQFQLFGFYQPVDMGGVLNTVKGGSTVPLKFEVFAGAELTTIDAIESVKAAPRTCDLGAAQDAIEAVTTGGTSLRYDLVGGQFIFNWQTPKAPGACYQVVMTTIDGQTISANFKLK